MASGAFQRERVAHVPSPWWGVLMLLGLAAAVGAIIIGGFYLWLAAAPAEVRVPEVTGINVRAAEQILARHGLIGQVVARKYDEQVPAETVLAASPAAGKTVRQGRAVELVLSDGPPTVTMPDVRETDLGQATQAISSADLHVARIKRRYDDAVPLGWVMAQAPEPGARVPRRGDAELVVSAGPRPRAQAPETPGEPGAAAEDLGEPRYAAVQVTLPKGGEPAMVRIEVEDRRGVNVVYNAQHDPGSTVTEVVTGYGDATARVYVDDNMIEEKRF